MMAIKELWVYLLAHNLIRLIMVKSAAVADCLPRQLSFKHSVQLWLTWRSFDRSCAAEELLDLLKLTAQQRVARRPGRVEPRALKRRARPFPLLMRKRSEARAEIRKNGHPKKEK